MTDSYEVNDCLGIYRSDDYDQEWTVSGDLREIVNLERTHVGTGQSTNHVIVSALIVEGWPAENLDPEWSCFFGYAHSEDEANKLKADAIRLALSLEPK